LQVLIVGQNQDYKNAKVSLCNSYSKTHCEGNNPFIALLPLPSIDGKLKGPAISFLKTVQNYQKVPFNKQIDPPVSAIM
jgi:hypothetical protein